jgi:hypothetical protein
LFSQKHKNTKTQKCKNAKTAMRGEKIFYTEKRRRHRHAREIFFHREAVKISSGGKNPGQFTQTEVIPIIFYTFTTNILIFILTFKIITYLCIGIPPAHRTTARTNPPQG